MNSIHIFKFFQHLFFNQSQMFVILHCSSLSFKMTCSDRNSHYFSISDPSLPPLLPKKTHALVNQSIFMLEKKKKSSSRKNSTAVQDVISYKINLLGRSNPRRGQVNDISGIIWSFSEICKPANIKALH